MNEKGFKKNQRVNLYKKKDVYILNYKYIIN